MEAKIPVIANKYPKGNLKYVDSEVSCFLSLIIAALTIKNINTLLITFIDTAYIKEPVKEAINEINEKNNKEYTGDWYLGCNFAKILGNCFLMLKA